MIGTANEIIDYLSRHSEYAQYMSMSRQRLAGLRVRLRTGTISEKRKQELLENLQKRLESLRDSSPSGLLSVPMVRCKRPSYTLPAIVRDHHGKLFTEIAVIKMAARETSMRDLNLNHVCGTFNVGYLPSEQTLRTVLKRKGWNLFEPRMVLPSVWEVVLDEDDSYATD